jgi:hypothetical protein
MCNSSKESILHSLLRNANFMKFKMFNGTTVSFILICIEYIKEKN